MSSPAPKYASNEGVADAIHALLTDAVVELVEAVGEISVTVQRETLPAVMVKLRDDLAYQQLMEIAGVDYPDRPERFEICYHLLRLTKNHRIRAQVATDADHPLPSIPHVWPVAGWLERDIHALDGVVLSANPP